MESQAKFASLIAFLMLFGTLTSLIVPVSADETVDYYPEGDAWLRLELLSWEGNQSEEWDSDNGAPDPRFIACSRDAERVKIDCFNSPTWDDSWTLGPVWNQSFDIPDDEPDIFLTIECKDNDALNDDECGIVELEIPFGFGSSIWSSNPFGSGQLSANSSWNVSISDGDSNGDGDADGVINYFDNCPDTVEGFSVDEYGCLDAWLRLELLDWEGNQSEEWDSDGSAPDPHFSVCVDADGENIDCFNSPTWDDSWTLGPVWNLTFDIPDDSFIINFTIECRDNDALNDDECDMNEAEDEWKLYFEFNWTTMNTTYLVADMHDYEAPGTDNWRNANSTWKVSILDGDADNDGVINNIDNCPNTEVGKNVDEVGCWWGQLDYDDDGIQNSEDNCMLWLGNNCESPENLFLGRTLPAENGGIGDVSFSPDGSLLASGTYDGTVKIWNTSTWTQEETPITGHVGGVHAVSFSSDGGHLAYCSNDGNVNIWDTLTWTRISTFAGCENSLSFSNDGLWLAFGDYTSSVNLMRTSDWVGGGGYAGGSKSATFSPDGTLLAFGSIDSSVRVHNISSGIPFQYLSSHIDVVTSIAFSPDGSLLASGSNDSTVRIWDTSTWTQIGPPIYVENATEVREITFSPDGSLFVSSFQDGNVRIWNTSTWTLIDTISSDAHSLVFSPDGLLLVMGLSNGTIEIWNGEDEDSNEDDDGDGIPNATDQCPNTPILVSVSLIGCSSSQVDSDADGVYDSSDDCPSTPAGSSVEANGCATSGDDVVDLDSDGDGVRDSVDQCPNSPPAFIDTNGCEIAWAGNDFDGDGVLDEFDKCARSPSGSDVNEEGCDPPPSSVVSVVVGCVILIVLLVGVVLFFMVKDGATSGTRQVQFTQQRPQQPIQQTQRVQIPQQTQRVQMPAVVKELERQKSQAEMEAQRLKQQLASKSVSESKMDAMQAELANLQRKVADSEHVKRQMEQEIVEMKNKGDSSFLMQDSVVAGDSLVGSTKIESQTINDPEAIARAAVEAYRMAKSEDKD